MPSPQQIRSDERNQLLHSLIVASGIALAIMAVVSLWLGWLVAGRVLRPIHTITATARRLSQETLHERIGLTGPRDELKDLADTFDAMLARLNSAFESQRRFIANASHELRSPLAEQRALVDVSLADPGITRDQLRQALERMRDTTDESNQLITSLMTLARSQRGIETQEDVSLAQVVEDALTRASTRLEARGIQVQSALDDVSIRGDPILLESIVSNLVDNAARYNHQNGWLAVSTEQANGHAVLEVSNSGPFVPPDAVPVLFEPFRRLDRDRTSAAVGTGLGLSIVRSAILAHGGTIRADARPEGGLAITVTLPAS